jgi:hypothetical protein
MNATISAQTALNLAITLTSLSLWLKRLFLDNAILG